MEQEPSDMTKKNAGVSETLPIKRPKKTVRVSAPPRDAGTIFPVGIEKYLKQKGWKIEKFAVGKKTLVLTISIPMSKAHFRTVKKVKTKKT